MLSDIYDLNTEIDSWDLFPGIRGIVYAFVNVCFYNTKHNVKAALLWRTCTQHPGWCPKVDLGEGRDRGLGTSSLGRGKLSPFSAAMQNT